MKTKRCPTCKSKMMQVIFTGFPMYLCKNETCNTVTGFWSFVMDFLPFNGVFMSYKGSYWKALWYWLNA